MLLIVMKAVTTPFQRPVFTALKELVDHMEWNEVLRTYCGDFPVMYVTRGRDSCSAIVLGEHEGELSTTRVGSRDIALIQNPV